MPFVITVEKKINKPLETVRRFVFEPTNEPYWVTGIIESHMLSVRPIGKGTQVQRIQKIQGNTIEYVYELKEFDPEGILSFVSLESPVSMEITYKLNRLSETQTRFTQVLKGSNRGITGIFDVFTAWSIKKTLKRDMKQLKKILEESG